jgi:hypothetical protein
MAAGGLADGGDAGKSTSVQVHERQMLFGARRRTIDVATEFGDRILSIRKQ